MRVDAGCAEPVRTHVPIVVAQLRMWADGIGSAGAHERRVVVERTGREVGSTELSPGAH